MTIVHMSRILTVISLMILATTGRRTWRCGYASSSWKKTNRFKNVFGIGILMILPVRKCYHQNSIFYGGVREYEGRCESPFSANSSLSPASSTELRNLSMRTISLIRNVRLFHAMKWVKRFWKFNQLIPFRDFFFSDSTSLEHWIEHKSI